MVRVGGTEVSGFLIFLLLVNLYFLLLYVLVKRGWLARMGMSLFGPALMIKTERGRGILDFFARARGLFIGSVTVGTWFTALVMVLMSLLLVLQLPAIIATPASQAPSPSLILGIPGVNPIIPLGYGIFALIFAVVVHELSHGILARCYNLRVKTMGILFLVIPIGAFVEPDEEDMQRAPRKHRVRVFGAGPTSNLFFALVFGFVFSNVLMAQAAPVEGAPILGVNEDGPACQAGLLPSWVVTHVGTDPDRAAATRVADREAFVSFVNGTTPGGTVFVHVADARAAGALAGHACVNATNMASGVFPVVTRPCADLYEKERCLAVTTHPDPLNRTVMGVDLYPVQEVYSTLANPFQSGRSFLIYFSLPFLALQNQFPLAGAFEDFYTTSLDPGTFWVLANTAYWLFWINLMLGLTNALPILPLDGGHMFRDYVGGFVAKVRPNATPERRDQIVRRLSLIVTLTLLALVVFQFVGPHLLAPFA